MECPAHVTYKVFITIIWVLKVSKWFSSTGKWILKTKTTIIQNNSIKTYRNLTKQWMGLELCCYFFSTQVNLLFFCPMLLNSETQMYNFELKPIQEHYHVHLLALHLSNTLAIEYTYYVLILNIILNIAEIQLAFIWFSHGNFE